MRSDFRKWARAFCSSRTPYPNPGHWDVSATDWDDEPGGSEILQALRDLVDYVFESGLQTVGGLEGEYTITNIDCVKCELTYEFLAGPGEFRAGSVFRIPATHRAFDVNPRRSIERTLQEKTAGSIPESGAANDPFGSHNRPGNTIWVFWIWDEIIKF